MSQIIRARAPLRLGLAGGGTDVSPYCDIYGGCVLNATIDRYAYAVIKTLDEPEIRFRAADIQVEIIETTSIPITLNGELDLHKATYNYMMQEFNSGVAIPMELSTYCDAPAGSGLGSSSTLVVAMIRAFVELMNLAIDDYAIAQLAYKIEREDCGLQGGRQDQFSATFGGVNFMEFYSDSHTIVSPLRIKNWILCELEASMILFFTGVSRASAHIIADQTSNVVDGHEKRVNAMHGIKKEAQAMKESLLRGDFDGMVRSLKDGWEAKKSSATSVSNSYIDKIYQTAMSAGALAGKVSGAGGGGFMLFYARTEKRMDVIRALEVFDGQISNCHFTKHGTQAWRL